MDISEAKPGIPFATFFSFLSQLAWSTRPTTIMKISLKTPNSKAPKAQLVNYMYILAGDSDICITTDGQEK